MSISWKCIEPAQTGPTSQVQGLFFSTEKSAKSELDFSFEVHLFGALYLSNRAVLGHVLVEL
jgi:hypothetical protein